jgi:hypothetical protein
MDTSYSNDLCISNAGYLYLPVFIRMKELLNEDKKETIVKKCVRDNHANNEAEHSEHRTYPASSDKYQIEDPCACKPKKSDKQNHQLIRSKNSKMADAALPGTESRGVGEERLKNAGKKPVAAAHGNQLCPTTGEQTDEMFSLLSGWLALR